MLKTVNISENNQEEDVLPSILSSIDVSTNKIHAQLTKTSAERPTSPETEKQYIGNADCKLLKLYLQQETTYEGKILCDTWWKRKYEICGMLTKKTQKKSYRSSNKSGITLLL